MKTTHPPLKNLLGSLGMVLLMVFAFGPSFASAESDGVLAGSGDAPQTQKGKRGFDGKKHKGAKRGHPIQKILQSLDLSQEQQVQLKKIIESQRETMKKFHKEHGRELKQWHQDMREARQNDDIDKQKDLLDQRKTLFKDMPSRKDALNKIKSVLTEEQIKQLDKKLKDMKKNRGKYKKGHRQGKDFDNKANRRGDRGNRSDRGDRGDRGNRGN